MAATAANLLVLTLDAGAPAGDVRVSADAFDTPEHTALVAAARAGSGEAFGQLVALHQRVVFRAALAALGRREDAEEAAQEAFLVAWQKLAGFRGDSSFRTWLLTITWRKALDRRRGRLQWWRREARAAPEAVDLLDRTPDHAADPERTAIAGDLARLVQAEIARLPPTLRDTLLLAASGEHAYQEIAAMLGVPLGTVKWRVSEARRLLTARLPSPLREERTT